MKLKYYFFFYFCIVIIDIGDMVFEISIYILRKERNNLGIDRI